MSKEIAVDLRNRSPEDLEMIAGFAVSALTQIANEAYSDELDRDDTEEEFGLGYDELIEMSRDNLIGAARNTLENISNEAWKQKQEK